MILALWITAALLSLLGMLRFCEVREVNEGDGE